MRVIGVIIAGGKGERFWPLSRIAHPKQMLCIGTEKPLLQKTVERIESWIGGERIIVVTSLSLLQPVRELLPQIPSENILGEPEGKNTAPAICWAATIIEKRWKEGVMVVLPSDHLIREEEKFLQVLKKGVQIARTGDFLLTIGIKPDRPETGYGYIEKGKLWEPGVWRVKRFREKPDLPTARKFLESGNFFWNSGMFIWRNSVILREISRYLPEVREGFQEWARGGKSIQDVYKKLPNISIDYGVMEKTKEILVLEGKFFWDDVGQWTSLERISVRDEKGNVIKGKYTGIEVENSIIVNEVEGKLITAIGVKDLVIVDTPDALLVSSKEGLSEIKRLLSQIREKREWKKYL